MNTPSRMRPPDFLITPAGVFRIEGYPDGSIHVTVPEAGLPFLPQLVSKLLLQDLPGWSASTTEGNLVLIPPEP